MKKDSLYTPLDHFQQAEIIAKLAAAESPIRFTDLKESGIENSLFMYHANKLINRGLVQKDDLGFSLTTKGARWANYVNSTLDLTPLTPRPLVQFIIEDEKQNILLAIRKGSLKQQLNDYLLPGNIYRYGHTLDANVRMILEELFERNEPTTTHITTADVIHTASDGFTSHVIVYLYCVTVEGEMPVTPSHELFTTVWMAREAITRHNTLFARSKFLPLLFERLPAIELHESFLINIK
jgi:ADP-ribose pyrophosphatase YjhB (NUDIX family)